MMVLWWTISEAARSAFLSFFFFFPFFARRAWNAFTKRERGFSFFSCLEIRSENGRKRTTTTTTTEWLTNVSRTLRFCPRFDGGTRDIAFQKSSRRDVRLKWKNIKTTSKRRMGMQSFHLSHVVLATKFVSEKSYMYDWWWWFSPELRVEPPVWTWRSCLIVNAKDDKYSLSWSRWEQKWWTISEALRSTQLKANMELALIDLVDRFSLSHHKLAFVNRND